MQPVGTSCVAAIHMSAPSRTEAEDQPEPDLADPAAAARAAKLRYVSDRSPGIARGPAPGGGFAYYQKDGSQVTDEAVLARIRKLAIPPAYTDVWICRVANGHLQGGRARRARAQAVSLSRALAADSG